MNLRAFLPLTALAWLVPAGAAHAQSPIDIRVWLPDDDGDYQESNEFERIDFFNLAHCQCSIDSPDMGETPGPGTFQVQLRLLDETFPFASEDADLVVGNDCGAENPDSRDCETITTIGDVINDLRSAPRYNVPAHRFMFPNDEGCLQRKGTPGVYVTFNASGGTVLDDYYFVKYGFDTEPPPLPQNIRANPGEGAVHVSWDSIKSRASDVDQFQILCANADGTPVRDKPDAPLYDTPFQLCGSDTPVNLFPNQGSSPQGPDAGVDPPDAGPRPEWMETLDPRYVCAAASSTETSRRVEGLENGQTYRLALLSIDDARNVVAADLGEVTPTAVTDFWEDYHDQGGSADGGLCLVTSTFGDPSGPTQALRDFRDRTLAASAAGRALIDAYYTHVAPLGAHADRSAAFRVAAALVLAPLAGLAAFWEYTGTLAKLLVLLALVLAIRAWRGRRRRQERAPDPAGPAPIRLQPATASIGLVVLALCAWPARASAQADPYWEEFEPIVEHEAESLPTSLWNVGIKLGPYTPDVDSELDASPGPYERMYGGAALMGMLQVERFLAWPLGQLGVALTLGYASKSANAFVICEPGEDECMDEGGIPPRAEGDKTSFRLIPASIGGIYRFTMLDDEWHVPLVPYARLGLSYYLWWITAPDGSVARAPTDDCPDLDGCRGDRALGASLGWEASVGLALRAERLDPQSARSLRNDLGIEHAGFYAELLYADVNGFGAEDKLHVGAFTWFAGVNFEF